MTGLSRGLQHARTQTLAAHLQKAEARDASHLDTRPVGLELVLEALFDRGVVTPLVHVDEVDHDEARKVAQAQLAGHFLGRFQVGLERGFLDRAFLGGPARVHVDRHQRLGHANHDVAARLELHHRVKHVGKVAFDLVAREERHRIGVMLHVLGMGRHDHFHEVLGMPVAQVALDQHLVDIAIVEVADRTVDQVAFLVDRRRRDRFQRQVADLFPLALQVFVVALDLGLGALGACGPHDQPRALRHVKRHGDFLELLAIDRIGDLAADPAATRGVGHQNAVATRQRQIGGQRRTLVATLFLDDLHQHDLAHLDHFLDLVAARARLAHGPDVFLVVVIGDGRDIGVDIGSVRLGRVALVLVVAVSLGVFGGVFAAVIFLLCVVGTRFGCGLVDLVFSLCSGGVRFGRVCLGHRLRRFVRDGFGRAGLAHQGRGIILLVEIDHIHARGTAALHIALGDRVRAAVGGLGFAPIRRFAAATARPLGLVLGIRLGLGLGARIFLFLGQQRLAVRRRDLVVIGVDFRKGQEAMAVSAIVHEGRLQRGFDPRDLRQIYVSCKLPLVQRLEIEFLDLVSVGHDNAGFFRVRGVDEHLLCHVILANDLAPTIPGGAPSMKPCCPERAT